RLGKVHTFTVGVQDADDDEVPYAGRVANLLHTQHEVVRVAPATYQESFEQIVRGFDFPVTDPAAIPQYLLAKAAKSSVDVILAGDGGDEIFGGRMVGTVAAQLRLSTLLTKMPGPARRLAAGVFGKQRPELHEPTMPVGLARRIGGLQIFDREARATLIRDPGWVRPGIRRSCLEPFYREVVSDPINEILHAWLRGRMAEDALARSGAAAALSGLALREPLLDRDLVSFCAGLPGSWKVRNGGPSGAVTKWPLREILRPILGRALVNRPKRVLPGPWRRWFEGPLKHFKEEQAARLRQDQLRLFLPGAVDNLLARMAEPGTDVKVWTLIFLDAWLREIRAV
ncbi:MAG TPA: asparagine synthase C-terminal domain-containing protein, partial [Myxococcota bacterium]|nr:asparagine synthase C-terminal domain-containing protein [Myxococcota bacterium]